MDISNLNEDFKSYILEYELNSGIAQNINKEKDAEIKTLDDKYKPKGEFETSDEYNLRISNANAEKQAIEKKYADIIEEAKTKKSLELTGFKEQVEENNQMKITESIRDTLLKISKIGIIMLIMRHFQ